MSRDERREQRHAEFILTLHGWKMRAYSDGGARTAATGATPPSGKSAFVRRWHKAFGGQCTIREARVLAAVADQQLLAGGAGGPKPKATAGTLPGVPRTSDRRRRR